MDGLSLDVRLAGEGDRDAYARLIRQTQNLVSSVALAVVRDVPASEDIAQEVYVHAWRGLGALRSAESFLPWLRQLTRNRAQAFLRERHRRTQLGALTGDAALAAAVDPSPDAHQALLRDEAQRKLARAIEGLSDEHREVITLFYREGQSVAQVAALLELSPEAVKKRLSRARAAVKEELWELLGEDLRKSAPGERFGAAVLAALPGASPGKVAPGLLAAAAKASSPAFGAALAAAVGGPLLAAATLRWGLNHELGRAQDDAERQSLRGLARVQLAFIGLAGAGTVAGTLLGQPALILGSMAAYVAVMLGLTAVWQGRIHRRRHALEWAAAPTEATRRLHALERRRWWVGLALGATLGLGTLALVTFGLSW